jgi:hypothetical protein
MLTQPVRLKPAEDVKPVRPAFYDDKFFSLLPGESCVICIKFADIAADPQKARSQVDGWNVETPKFIASIAVT